LDLLHIIISDVGCSTEFCGGKEFGGVITDIKSPYGTYVFVHFLRHFLFKERGASQRTKRDVFYDLLFCLSFLVIILSSA
jgi:hypothetical protein